MFPNSYEYSILMKFLHHDSIILVAPHEVSSLLCEMKDNDIDPVNVGELDYRSSMYGLEADVLVDIVDCPQHQFYQYIRNYNETE